ncbi:MAG: hypothetical protein A2W91_00195 [Bacteroidetes bacterium GWF2_38_335]|nr:MAG: hypothetical protein A2W91_00195 [Bacteroidetes bacterium GWF2_38_335]OFY78254.1 MAG: hypothetical protein A2281_03575 [Bacteroidetes bacterium RIFOXYA12_FULL_38_20]HBS87553.1 hypothetical protein [Bacteroidales bacterium]
MNSLYRYLIITVLLFGTVAVHSQDTARIRIRPMVEAGYVFGGMVYNYNYVYNPGGYFNVAAMWFLTEKEAISLSGGYAGLQKNDRFFPIKLSLTGFTKKQKDGMYYSFATGYSFADDLDLNKIEGYNLRGGFLFESGIGRRIFIGDYSIMMGISYWHQLTQIIYDIPGNTVNENVNYDNFKFELKLIF